MRCAFTHRAHPPTAGTPEDTRRLWLSTLLTSILVSHGDEKPGQYVPPPAQTSLAAHIADLVAGCRPTREELARLI